MKNHDLTIRHKLLSFDNTLCAAQRSARPKSSILFYQKLYTYFSPRVSGFVLSRSSEYDFLKSDVKFGLWKTNKIWKNLPHGFDKSADLPSKRQNHEEDFFSNYMCFSKSPNFKWDISGSFCWQLMTYDVTTLSWRHKKSNVDLRFHFIGWRKHRGNHGAQLYLCDRNNLLVHISIFSKLVIIELAWELSKTWCDFECINVVWTPFFLIHHNEKCSEL